MSTSESSQAVYSHVLLSLRRNITSLYLLKIELSKKLRRDDVHKEIIAKKRKLEDCDGFDEYEAIRYAIKKRKYIIQDVNGIFSDCVLDTEDNEDDGDDDDHNIDGDAVWIPENG